MIVEIALCGTAAFLFGRGIYHSGVLSGWIVQGLRQIEPPSAPPAAPIQTVAPWTDEDAKREMELFVATGETCWWLDPNRWGDDPKWRDRLVFVPTPYLDADPPVPALVPDCPSCGSADRVSITAEHGGEASAWYCAPCHGDFTRRRRFKPRPSRLTVAEMTPPAMPSTVYVNPQATVRMVEAHPAELPCGCSWNESITQTHGRGYSFSRCNRCHRWWELPSNGQGKGRQVAQGEYVHDRDDMDPTAQREWRLRPGQHGVCPSDICQFPVAKRDGKYYCTNTDCNHHYKGWR
jgi:hypothetical protein